MLNSQVMGGADMSSTLHKIEMPSVSVSLHKTPPQSQADFARLSGEEGKSPESSIIQVTFGGKNKIYLQAADEEEASKWYENLMHVGREAQNGSPPALRCQTRARAHSLSLTHIHE